ncbi:MAG: hypothetical protein ACRDNG_08630 [Gaiellaceae bacterium]
MSIYAADAYAREFEAVVVDVDWTDGVSRSIDRLLPRRGRAALRPGDIWRDHEAKVTGASMEPLCGRMDFELEGLSAALVREIEKRVNVEVEADRPVRVDFLPREEADRRPELIRTKVSLLPPRITTVRTVEIEGLDLQADGGTHVARTGEIGPVTIRSTKARAA